MRIIIETEAEGTEKVIATANTVAVAETIDGGTPSEDIIDQITIESSELSVEGDDEVIDGGSPPQELIEAIEGVAGQEGEDAGAAPDN